MTIVLSSPNSYANSRKKLRKLAKKGDAAAVYISRGNGSQYLRYFDIPSIRDKAEQGDLRASYELGILLGTQGGTHDFVETYLKNIPKDDLKNDRIYWLHLAAENGYAPAQTEMGRLYMDGIILDITPRRRRTDVYQHCGEARYWLERAANQGHQPALYHLASTYSSLTSNNLLCYDSKTTEEQTLNSYLKAIELFNKAIYSPVAATNYSAANELTVKWVKNTLARTQVKAAVIYSSNNGALNDYNKAEVLYSEAVKNCTTVPTLDCNFFQNQRDLIRETQNNETSSQENNIP